MALEGLDPEVVTQLANQLKTQSQAIGGVIAHVDGIVSHIEGAWQGHTASEFASWWRQQHRPGLVGAQVAVDGLHQSALNNVAQQEAASGNLPGGGGLGGWGGGGGGWGWGRLPVYGGPGFHPFPISAYPFPGMFQGVDPNGLGGPVIGAFPPGSFPGVMEPIVKRFSDDAGWAVGPLAGAKMPVFDTAMKVDQFARFGQDLWQGHVLPTGGGSMSGNGSNAFDELANIGGTFSLAKFSPVGFMVDVNDRLWQGVGDAASAIDWHDMNAINPFSPTSGFWGSYGVTSGSFWSDIGQSEWTGLSSVGVNIFKDTVGGFIGKLF